MRNLYPLISRSMMLGTLASFGMAAACTGELDTENAEEGMIPTEITSDTEGEADPTKATAPGMVTGPELEGSMANDTEGPPMGAGALDEDAVGAGAEPGQPVGETPPLDANRATE